MSRDFGALENDKNIILQNFSYFWLNIGTFYSKKEEENKILKKFGFWKNRPRF